MEKMTAVVGKTTGHLLGVLTRAADPEGTLEAADLVGEGLPLRHPVTGEEWLTVDARDLAVEVVDFMEAALLEPHRHRIDNGIAVLQAPLEPAVPPERVTLALNGVTVTLPFPITEPVTVWVQIEGGPDNLRLSRELTIPAPPSLPTAMEPLQLLSGQYQTLTLAPDYGANFKRFLL